MKYEVTLTPEDVAYCREIADMRTNERQSSGAPSNLMHHTIGCYGEYAVAKYYRLPWEGRYYEGKSWKNRGNDVKGLEVKASFNYDNLSLECHDPDMFPHIPFIFVKLTSVGDTIIATLKGWIYGRDAKKYGINKTSRSNKPFILIHRRHFYTMDSLPTCKSQMLNVIQNLCSNCTMCRLGRKDHEAKGETFDPHVFSNMQISRFGVFGQNPGFNECLQKEPFVGQAGMTFDTEIEKYGLSRSDFYISNILKCHTDKNRAPLPEELRACRPILLMELEVIKPKLVITLGKFAFEAFCPGVKYTPNLGTIQKSKILQGKTLNVFPVYHPSGMNLSQKARRQKFEADVKMLCRLVKKLND